MKWGHHTYAQESLVSTQRTRRPGPVIGFKKKSTDSNNSKNTTQNKEQIASQRKQKVIKAAKVGAAVAGTALAAYGTYKAAKYVRDKRDTEAWRKANEFYSKHRMRPINISLFDDNSFESTYSSRNGDVLKFKGSGKDYVPSLATIRDYNATQLRYSDKIHDEAVNTRLDRNLNRIVKAGDAVGRQVTKHKNRVKDAARKVKHIN